MWQPIVIFCLSSCLIFAASSFFAFSRELAGKERLVLAAVLGAIATARSPASAIAIIKETRSRGPFTEAVLSLTVAVDILAIVLFALVISASEAVLTQQGMDAAYVAGLLLEIFCSLALGVGLGLALAAWLSRIRSHHLITVFILAIVVSELSQALSHMLDARFGLDFHLEPMLICIATGFVVRNFSSQGRPFLDVIEKGGPLVYTLFFALAGAALDLQVLQSAWLLALLLVLIRFGSIQLGAWIGARFGRGGPVFERYLGITFVTQAGVSLGLAKVVESRFPGWGAAVATLAVASISINQLVGPILFKHALGKAGETGGQDHIAASEVAPPSPGKPARTER